MKSPWRAVSTLLCMVALLLGAICPAALPVPPEGTQRTRFPAAPAATSKIFLPMVMRDWQNIAPPASITLTANASAILPGNTVGLQWQVGGGTSGLELWIRAREPGQVYTTAGALAFHPGVRPPTGRLLYLRPDGSWTTTPTAYQAGAASGGTTRALPSSLEGQWSLEALLHRATNDSIEALAAVALLVSATPQINLRLNRPIANATDRVRVQLATSAGSPTRNVTITAWLVKPDGTQLSFPALETGLQFVYQGVSGNAEYTLLDTHLGPMGTGNYRFQARMLDGATGALLGTADAGVSVCDGPAGSVSGKVYSSLGQPLGGGSPTLASVKAFDVDDGGIAASATIGADGSYPLALTPGRYLLSADVMDSNGWHQAVATKLAVLGCDGPNVALNLTAATPKTFKPLVPKTSLATIASACSMPSYQGCNPNACDGLPHPRILVKASGFDPNSLHEMQLNDIFSGRLVNAEGDVTFSTDASLNAAGRMVTLALLMGVDDHINLDNFSRLMGADLFMMLSFTRDDQGKYLVASLLDTNTGDIIRRVISASVPLNSAYTLAQVDEVACRMVMYPQDPWGKPRLLHLLRYKQEKPVLPYLTLSVSPAEVNAGASVIATTSLREKDASGAWQPDCPIKLENNQPASTIWLDRSGNTDANGQYAAALPVGSAAGEGSVRAQFTRRSGVLQERFARYRVVAPGDLQLTSPHAEIKTGENEPAKVKLRRNGQPVVGQSITLASNRGTLSAPSVTTDANGEAMFTFTGGLQSGLANIQASTQVPNGPVGSKASAATLTAELPLMVDAGINFVLLADRQRINNSVSTQVTAELIVGGARVSALPVQFSVAGGGTLSAGAGQTDVNGRASVDYTSPASGTGSAVITATAMVDNQSYTRTTTINYEPGPGCQPTGGASYCITDIGPTNLDYSRATINNRGQVAYSFVEFLSQSDLGWRAYLWENGTVSSIGGAGATSTGINNLGQVCGYVVTATDRFWGSTYGAFLWSKDAGLSNLGAPGSNQFAFGINDAGTVVGYSDHNHATLPNQDWHFIPGKWQSGNWSELGWHCAGHLCRAAAINNSNQILVDVESTPYQVYLWDNGATSLFSLQGVFLSSIGINDFGTPILLGTSISNTSTAIWQNGVMRDIDMYGRAINNRNEVVGYSGNLGARIWKNVMVTDLNTQVAPASGWTLQIAWDINDSGQIVGTGTHNGAPRFFLLTPAGQ